MIAKKDWEAVADDETMTEDEHLEEEALKDLAEQEDIINHELSDIKELQAAMKDAEEKASENFEKMLRAISELENTRRRAERDVENAHKYSLEKFTNELIPVVDSLESALESLSQGGDHAEGLELTHKMFLDVLAKFSIKQINPVGEPFDPKLHEAMSMQESPDAKSGTVITVFQKGYLLYERVVRPARVIVAK